MDNEQKNQTQLDLIMEYFKKNPKRDIKHPEIVDWIVSEYKKRTGKIFRDPDRGIRRLHQDGLLVKVKKGVYKYDPEHVKLRKLEDFSTKQKEQILKRDNYRCVICGKGKEDGAELHVDHIKPKELGGKATMENGQVLCSQHNFQKKHYRQTETGKRMFIRLYELAKKQKDEKLKKFCADVLEVYTENDINGHIVWKK